MSDAKSAGGYFEKVELVPPDHPNRIDLTRVHGSGVAPAAMMTLAADIQTTARLVGILFEHDARRKRDYLEQLHMVADTGLRGPDASVEAGTQGLKEVRDSIASDFVSVRSHYYWRYFVAIVVLGLPCMIFGGLAYLAAYVRTGTGPFPFGLESSLSWVPRIADVSAGYPLWVILAICLFWIPAGAVLGVFIEFILRVENEVTYDMLSAINPGRWNVGQRLINTILVGLVFAALMGMSVLQVGLFGLLLNDFSTTKPYLAAVVGFITGFSYSYVRDILYKVRPEVKTS